ncbi:MAG TPA: XdhC family protein [Blastocatellia bacterium]|nr:XdhC family protein [Blastocatellia bacterium]
MKTWKSERQVLNIIRASLRDRQCVFLFRVIELGARFIGIGAVSGGYQVIEVGEMNILDERVANRVEADLLKCNDYDVSIKVFDNVDGRLTVVRECLRPESELLVIGAGHVGQALAWSAAIAGYRVVVVDDREEFLTPLRFFHPNIRTQLVGFGNLHRYTNLENYNAIAIVTRGHQYDELCLSQVVNCRVPYIGMIGSRKRIRAVFNRLVEKGVANWRQLERVHAPIGLSIGAKSPQEIGVAVLAEVIQCLNLKGK